MDLRSSMLRKGQTKSMGMILLSPKTDWHKINNLLDRYLPGSLGSYSLETFVQLMELIAGWS